MADRRPAGSPGQQVVLVARRERGGVVDLDADAIVEDTIAASSDHE